MREYRKLRKTTITVTQGPPDVKDPIHPKGGVYDRMEKLMLTPNETWDNVITRVLDFWDEHHKVTDART